MRLPREIGELKFAKDSSNVEGYYYDKGTATLYIQFKGMRPGDGPLYKYLDVPDGTYRRFDRAPSKGKYLWTHIRDKFRYGKWMGTTWKYEKALRRDVEKRKRLRELE